MPSLAFLLQAEGVRVQPEGRSTKVANVATKLSGDRYAVTVGGRTQVAKAASGEEVLSEGERVVIAQTEDRLYIVGVQRHKSRGRVEVTING